MGETKASLSSRLIRNLNEAPLNRAALEPKYDCSHARLSAGTAASALAAGLASPPAV